MTRLITEKTRAYEFNRSSEVFPPANEKMSVEEMILGDNNLLEAEQEGFSHNMPKEVYITGKKVN